MLNLNENTALQFYQSLGQLFYATAAVDNKVMEEERNAVFEIVEKHWLHQDLINTISKNDAKSAIIETFNQLYEENKYDADACYARFLNFKNENESIFTKDIKRLILKSVGKISASFSGQNKSELMLLANLSIEFKKGNQ